MANETSHETQRRAASETVPVNCKHCGETIVQHSTQWFHACSGSNRCWRKSWLSQDTVAEPAIEIDHITLERIAAHQDSTPEEQKDMVKLLAMRLTKWEFLALAGIATGRGLAAHFHEELSRMAEEIEPTLYR